MAGNPASHEKILFENIFVSIQHQGEFAWRIFHIYLAGIKIVISYNMFARAIDVGSVILYSLLYPQLIHL